MKTKVLNKAKFWLFSVLFALATLCLSLGFASIGQKQRTAHAAEAIVTMEDGGSFRYAGGTPGLGFITRVDYAKYNALVADTTVSNIETGTLFVRKKDASKASITLDNETFTKDSFDGKEFKSYREVPNVGWMHDEETSAEAGYYSFRGSVVNMKQLNYEKDYCARGYIKYDKTDDEGNVTTVCEYTSYNEAEHCRSIETIAMAAIGDTSPTYDENKYKYEVSAGVYSPFDENGRAAINGYTPRTVEDGVIFGGDSLDYLYYADDGSAKEYTQCSGSDWTNSTVKSNSDLSDATLGLALNGYEGSAVAITNFSLNMRAYVQLPSRYADEAATKYRAIRVWFAMAKSAEANAEDTMKITGSDSYIANGTDIVMGAENDYEFNKFHCIELALPSAGGSCWADGYLRLWHLAATAASDAASARKNHTFYLGEVTYVEADAPEKILNGLTDKNYTQYKLEGRNDGTDREFLSAADVATANLAGGYTGAAVQFRPSNNNPVSIDFPADASHFTAEKADAAYLTLWVALKTHEKDYAITGQLTFSTDYLYNKNSVVYAKNNKNWIQGTTHVRWNTAESASFKVDTWYQLYLPLTAVTGTYLDGTIEVFKLLYENDFGTEQNKFRILIGNVGVATQAEMEASRSQEQAEIISSGLTKDNYTQYKRGGAVMTFKSSEQLESEYTSLTGDYTGDAVASAKPGNGNTYTIDVPKSSLPTSGSVYIWVAVVTENGYAPADGDRLRMYGDGVGTFPGVFGNGTTASDMQFNKWYKIERTYDKLVTNENGCVALSLGLFSDGSSTWATNQANFTILIGDFGIVEEVEE